MLAQLKYGTPTSQIFWGCDESDTGGVLGVFVDGNLTTGDTLSASNDYTGTVEVSGLSKGSHTWQMAIDGVAVGGVYTFNTVPSQGDDLDVVVISDCTGLSQGFSTITAENAHFGITNGDHYYLDVVPSFTDNCGCGTLPTGTDAVDYNTVLATYRCKHRCHLSFGTLREVAFRQHPWVFNWHNHEFEVQPFQTTTIADNAGIKYQAAKKAADEYMFAGNPPATGTWDTYPNPRVYRDFVVGDCHFIQLDHTSYGFESASARSLFEGSVPDGAGGTNTGDKQLDWAIATIQNSTSKFIIIVSPAEPVHTSSSALVGGQWDTLLTAIDALSGKTVFLICGDTHQMLVELLGGTKMPNNPMLVVNASPLQHPSRSTASTGWGSDATIYFNDLKAPPNPAVGDIDNDFNYNYLTLHVRPNGDSQVPESHIKIKIKNAMTGNTRASFYIREGERIPVFDNNRAVI